MLTVYKSYYSASKFFLTIHALERLIRRSRVFPLKPAQVVRSRDAQVPKAVQRGSQQTAQKTKKTETLENCFSALYLSALSVIRTSKRICEGDGIWIQ